MELIHEIEYNGKTYPVKEPTLSMWMDIMTMKNLEDHLSIAVRLIALSTGLREDEIQKASAGSVYSAAEGLIETYTEESEKFREVIEFKGRTYRFVNLKGLTFGEFIDIDDIMTKSESERIKRLPLLMALLYREVDEEGNYLEYDTERISRTAELFKDLPMRYMNSSMVFFYRIESILRRNTPYYLWTRTGWKIQTTMTLKRIQAALDGIVSSFSWLRKIYYGLRKWSKSITSKPSILSRIKRTSKNNVNEN